MALNGLIIIYCHIVSLGEDDAGLGGFSCKEQNMCSVYWTEWHIVYYKQMHAVILYVSKELNKSMTLSLKIIMSINAYYRMAIHSLSHL